MKQDGRYLSVRETAQLLGFSRKHTYELLQSGKLRAVKVWGNRWRVPLDAVQALKAAKELVSQ